MQRGCHIHPTLVIEIKCLILEVMEECSTGQAATLSHFTFVRKHPFVLMHFCIFHKIQKIEKIKEVNSLCLYFLKCKYKHPLILSYFTRIIWRLLKLYARLSKGSPINIGTSLPGWERNSTYLFILATMKKNTSKPGAMALACSPSYSRG